MKSISVRSMVATVILIIVVIGFQAWVAPGLFRLFLADLRNLDKTFIVVGVMTFALGFLTFYMDFSQAAERKEIDQELNTWPIPLRVLSDLIPAGGTLRYNCRGKECKGFLATTVVCQRPSQVRNISAGLAEMAKIFQRDNLRGREMGLRDLPKYRAALGGQDRFFCMKCGIEHKDVTALAEDPMNLHDIVRSAMA